jgi:dihydrofolate reductase
MNINIIAAVALNGVIGNQGRLPWSRISTDLQHFFNTTVNHTVIMGATTFLDDLKGRSLYDRQNIVLTKQRNDILSHYINVEVANSVDKALALAVNNEVFIIGGAKVYEAFLPLANTMYITHIFNTYTGDTYFPSIDWGKYRVDSVLHKDDTILINKYCKK